MGRVKEHGEAGFTLVELLVAMVITVVGVVAVTVMIMYGIRLQTVSRDSTAATALARAKIEELRLLPVIDPRRVAQVHCASLTANVNNKFDVAEADGSTAAATGRFTRRWCVGPGPAGTGIDEVWVVVTATDPRRGMFAPAQLHTLLQ